jgi:hypothetical protein
MACTAKTHENEHLSYTQKETDIDTGMKPRQTATGITTTETKKEGKPKKKEGKWNPRTCLPAARF